MRNFQDLAIRFGDSVDKGLGDNKVFPFFLSFLAKESDTWDTDKANLLSPSFLGGPLVVPNNTLDWQIPLSQDYNYKILWAKYSVYMITLSGVFVWYAQPAGWPGETDENAFDYNFASGTPLTRFVNLSFYSYPTQRYMYGGKNLTPNIAGGDLVPIPINVMQGYPYGPGQIYTEYFLPRQSMIVLKITNTFAFPVYVTGMIYGMKVRI